LSVCQTVHVGSGNESLYLGFVFALQGVKEGRVGTGVSADEATQVVHYLQLGAALIKPLSCHFPCFLTGMEDSSKLVSYVCNPVAMGYLSAQEHLFLKQKI
jgi:hypothetical protein